jgi:hypothetical protein
MEYIRPRFYTSFSKKVYKIECVGGRCPETTIYKQTPSHIPEEQINRYIAVFDKKSKVAYKKNKLTNERTSGIIGNAKT